MLQIIYLGSPVTESIIALICACMLQSHKLSTQLIVQVLTARTVVVVKAARDKLSLFPLWLP